MKIKRFQTPLLPASKNLLALCFVALTGFNALIFVFILFLSFRINILAARKTTFVQLVNGETLVVSERDRYWRYPSVIQNTVRTWTELTFNWDNKIPGTNETDTGVRVGKGGKRIPTSTYFASLLLESEFAKAALSEIAELVPSSVFSGKLRSTIIIPHSAP